MVVNNRGYVDTFYKGRLSTLEFSGRFEIRIWNLYPLDTGIYRCMIHGTSTYIYQDFSCEVSGKTILMFLMFMFNEKVTSILREKWFLWNAWMTNMSDKYFGNKEQWLWRCWLKKLMEMHLKIGTTVTESNYPVTVMFLHCFKIKGNTNSSESVACKSLRLMRFY